MGPIGALTREVQNHRVPLHASPNLCVDHAIRFTSAPLVEKRCWERSVRRLAPALATSMTVPHEVGTPSPHEVDIQPKSRRDGWRNVSMRTTQGADPLFYRIFHLGGGSADIRHFSWHFRHLFWPLTTQHRQQRF